MKNGMRRRNKFRTATTNELKPENVVPLDVHIIFDMSIITYMHICVRDQESPCVHIHFIYSFFQFVCFFNYTTHGKEVSSFLENLESIHNKYLISILRC